MTSSHFAHTWQSCVNVIVQWNKINSRLTAVHGFFPSNPVSRAISHCFTFSHMHSHNLVLKASLYASPFINRFSPGSVSPRISKCSSSLYPSFNRFSPGSVSPRISKCSSSLYPSFNRLSSRFCSTYECVLFTVILPRVHCNPSALSTH